jgi:hypothetical protein
MLGGWRREARRRLPEMHDLVRARHDIMGELAHVSIPDLKEAEGGLRDATALKALVASWLVDVPHVEVERCRQALLDTRDVLHAVAGRATDRINPEMWAQLAEPLGLEDAGAVQSHVRELGRRMTHIARLTWHRVDQVVARPTSLRGARKPDLRTVAPGIALSSGEIVLDKTAKPATDPVMLLRAAAEAAERGVAVDTITIPLHDVDRARLDGEDEGLFRVHLARGTDRIVGATLVAAHAGDMISEVTLAMTAGIGLGRIANVIHPYPTVAEAIRKAGDAYNRTRLTPRVKRLFSLWLRWRP